MSRYGVGVDAVDTDAAQEHGVWVCNVPDYGTVEVRCTPSRCCWHSCATSAVTTVRCVPGTGTTTSAGSCVGQLLDPWCCGTGSYRTDDGGAGSSWFGAVVGYDPYLPDAAWPHGMGRLGLEEVFARSSAITLHLPLTEDTHGLVGTERLARMPNESYLVNTARGGLVDLDAVLEALQSGQLAGAALDVLPQEPPPRTPAAHSSTRLDHSASPGTPPRRRSSSGARPPRTLLTWHGPDGRRTRSSKVADAQRWRLDVTESRRRS